MSNSHVAAATLDDLLRPIFQIIRAEGRWVEGSRGSKVQEVTGMLLELQNPRARLSRTEARGKPFSCLGELAWYLSSSRSREFIEYYIRAYTDPEGPREIPDAYGPRLVSSSGRDGPLFAVIDLLKSRESSKRAVIPILHPSDDINTANKDEVPCTCLMQFLVRGGTLQMHVYMRSNDVCRGLPHDIFCFTMIQELVARSVGCEPGRYLHHVGSLHCYENDASKMEEFLNEGWQSVQPMPAMPQGDPWTEVKEVLRLERALREGDAVESADLGELSPYWSDLVRLLCALRATRDKDQKALRKILDELEWPGYATYVHSRADALASAASIQPTDGFVEGHRPEQHAP